jgi:hypothetical protein
MASAKRTVIQCFRPEASELKGRESSAATWAVLEVNKGEPIVAAFRKPALAVD